MATGTPSDFTTLIDGTGFIIAVMSVVVTFVSDVYEVLPPTKRGGKITTASQLRYKSASANFVRYLLFGSGWTIFLGFIVLIAVALFRSATGTQYFTDDCLKFLCNVFSILCGILAVTIVNFWIQARHAVTTHMR